MKRFLLVLFSTVCAAMLCSCNGFSDLLNFSEQLESVSLSAESLSLTVGDTTELSVSYEPENAETKQPEWTTSDSGVADVDDDGTVRAISSGTAIITVSAGNGLTDKCTVTVIDKQIESIVLNVSSAGIKEGKTIQLEYTCTPADAPTGGIIWGSSDSDIASVDSNGYVKGVSQGTAEITCSAPSGARAVCEITVKSTGSESATASATEGTTAAATTSQSSSSSSSSSSASSSSAAGSDDFIFPDSSQRKLTEAEVSQLTSDEVQDAINEIYARNGYVFQTESLNKYYSSKSWYKADSSFSFSDLNSYESYNINLLSKYR